MNHDELTEIARKWLLRNFSQNGPGCKVALKEVGAATKGEIADAWGYRWGWHGGSVLVEVKVSRSDFLADFSKPHRNGEVLGMGNYRYYMCPEGMIKRLDLPSGWGLLWVNNRGHIKPQCGHIVCSNQYADTDHLNKWRHEANTIKELESMAHILGRVSDPQKVNDMIRAANNERASIAKENQRLKERQKKNSFNGIKIANAIYKLELISNKSEEIQDVLDDLKCR